MSANSWPSMALRMQHLGRQLLRGSSTTSRHFLGEFKDANLKPDFVYSRVLIENRFHLFCPLGQQRLLQVLEFIGLDFWKVCVTSAFLVSRHLPFFAVTEPWLLSPISASACSRLLEAC
ncbi:hypothetical protein Tco_0593531 [Tanacetum coccineum]